MISAKIIADSVSREAGTRLTTFVLKFPRFILAEVNTHRQLSRNASSSRAIPVVKLLRTAIHDTVYPVYWGQNARGMQADGELPKSRQWIAQMVWRASCLTQVFYAWVLSRLGVHKQIANRLIETFNYTTVIISGTEWGNFFNLRAHPDAQPEFQVLAYAMLEAYEASTPRYLAPGDWHLPFADNLQNVSLEEKLKIVTARCARVSYLNFEGEIDHQKDFRLHDTLLRSGHCSPFEHAARAEAEAIKNGNFRGFTQYRKLIPNECRQAFDIKRLLEQRKHA